MRGRKKRSYLVCVFALVEGKKLKFIPINKDARFFKFFQIRTRNGLFFLLKERAGICADKIRILYLPCIVSLDMRCHKQLEGTSWKNHWSVIVL